MKIFAKPRKRPRVRSVIGLAGCFSSYAIIGGFGQKLRGFLGFMNLISLQNLGLKDYGEALKTMMTAHSQRVHCEIPDTIFIVEHNPVITRGRRLQGQQIPSQDEIEKRGILVCDADRGGLLTYHGPGQVVVYFVIELAQYALGISDFVTQLEIVLLDFLNVYGVKALRLPDHPGIWVGEQKIASLGLRVEKGVTRHGISLNICNDLSIYQLFDPCGLPGTTMTNLQTVLKRKISAEEFQEMKNHLGQMFCTGLELARGGGLIACKKPRKCFS